MDSKRDNDGIRIHTGIDPAPPGRQAHWLAWIICIVAAFAMSPVQADQWSLLLNGKAIHLENPPGSHYNEKNWGAGVQYDFDMSASKWIPFLTASGFLDSNNNPSYYAGGGTVRRFAFGESKDSLHVDAGVVVFLMVRKDFMNGDPFPGLLPVLSFGTDRVAINMTYIPKVEPKMVPLLFFQMKIGLF